MFNARLMKNKALEAREPVLSQHIFSQIREAADHGNLRVRIENMNDIDREILQDLGFVVYDDATVNTMVSWEHA